MNLTRREFLKLLALGSAGLGVGLATLYLTNPNLAKLILNSVKKGKVLDDIKEILISRLPQDASQLDVNTLTKHEEDWTSRFFNNVYLCSTTAGVSMAFMEVPGTTASPLNIEIQDYEDQKIIAQSVVNFPLPQYEEHVTEIMYEGTDSKLSFAMCALINMGSEVINIGRYERSQSRGGLLLTAGQSLIVTPEEFEKVTSFDAYFEYALALDSNTLAADLEAYSASATSINRFKDPVSSREYTSAIMTMYDQESTPRTYIVSNFQKGGSRPEEWHTILEMIGYCNTFANTNNAARYTVAIPDPHNASRIFIPSGEERIVVAGDLQSFAEPAFFRNSYPEYIPVLGGK